MSLCFIQGQFDVDRLLRDEAHGGAPSGESIRVKRSRDEISGGDILKTSDEGVLEKRVKRKCVRREINKIDPIMLEPVKKNAFFFIRPNGTVVAFNIDSLVDYLLFTGEFNDPETRIPFSDKDLMKIDTLAESFGLKRKSVYQAKLNAAQLYADLHFRRDALLGWTLLSS